jgi:hypothetical protein
MAHPNLNMAFTDLTFLCTDGKVETFRAIYGFCDAIQGALEQGWTEVTIPFEKHIVETLLTPIHNSTSIAIEPLSRSYWQRTTSAFYPGLPVTSISPSQATPYPHFSVIESILKNLHCPHGYPEYIFTAMMGLLKKDYKTRTTIASLYDMHVANATGTTPIYEPIIIDPIARTPSKKRPEAIDFLYENIKQKECFSLAIQHDNSKIFLKVYYT